MGAGELCAPFLLASSCPTHMVSRSPPARKGRHLFGSGSPVDGAGLPSGQLTCASAVGWRGDQLDSLQWSHSQTDSWALCPMSPAGWPGLVRRVLGASPKTNMGIEPTRPVGLK